MKPLVSLAMVASLSLVASLAHAQNAPRRFVEVDPSKIETVQPTGWAPLDANGNVVGPIQAIPGTTRRSASWMFVFDSMNSQSNTLPATGTTPPSLQTLWFIPDNYRAFMWANDMQALNTSMLGVPARGAYLGFYWNPNGTVTPGGTLNFAAKIYAARGFDSTGDGPAFSSALGGVMVTLPNLAVGSSPTKALSFNLSGTTGSIPMPTSMSVSNPAGLVVEFGSFDAQGNFVPFNPVVVCSPLFGNMRAPGEPRFPGTNPSRSGEFYWTDDANPFAADGIPNYAFEDFTNTAQTSFPFSELYSGNTEFDPVVANRRGIVQPAIALYHDQNARRITGTLVFNDQMNSAKLPKSATFQILNSTGTTVLSSQTVALSGTQGFTLADPAAYTGGSYIIRYVQGNAWVSKRSGLISTTSSVVTNIGNLQLKNGDVDQSTEVDAADIDVVIANFGGAPDDGLGGDVDLSGEVDAADIDIVIANFGSFGE